MERATKLRMTGYVAFLLSGLCAIASGIVVSILQEIYGFNYSFTGTLLAFMSIGNVASSFAAGILPSRIGSRNTVAIMCIGYFLGYVLMMLSGAAGVLIFAFIAVGLAKGCALNNCTILVGNNSADRTKGISLLHACYATGALLCPFVIGWAAGKGRKMPMLAVAAMGLLMWLIFMAAGLEKRTADGSKKEKLKLEFLKNKKFWLVTALIFCQNAAETSVTGWLVTYYRDQGILTGALSSYTVTVLWAACLTARLLLAFVIPIRRTFRALAIMGGSCTLLYAAMMFMRQPIWAIVMLFAFAFSIAGVNPIGVASVGRIMSSASMGILLPVAAFGAILMPWFIGFVADAVSLQAGMMCNLLPCAGIMVLSLIIRRIEKEA